ncbi:hypothetical protein GLE_3201 [Lysobacter enzymogenes]|uniref:Uncharacterized protein n=1 Tax=Lysobacter enzymogenes TaxID=69 RepID=A0A0S2DJ52_LYSEN|nr:hypothetical protein GLE_3201 [Lysobacter enzymogenes]
MAFAPKELEEIAADFGGRFHAWGKIRLVGSGALDRTHATTMGASTGTGNPGPESRVA